MSDVVGDAKRSVGYAVVADASTVRAGDVLVVEVAGRSLCLAHLPDGSWGAIDNVCTHDGGVLGEGELDDCCIECPRHGSRFDMLTGEVMGAPADIPVNAYDVRVVEGRIEVSLEPRRLREG